MRITAGHLLSKFSTPTGIAMLGLVVAGGCDTADHEADRQIQTSVSQAMLVTEPERTQKLESASGLSEASSASKAQAKSALGQAHVDAANELLDELGRSQIDIAKLMWQVGQVAGQIAHTNTLAEGYRQLDPKEASDEISKKIAEARGSGEAAWFTHGGATIPTLASVTQEIARLDGEIAKLEEQSRQLTAQRSTALDQSEQAARQAETLAGKPGVDEYKRGSDLRKQAADLSIEMDKIEAALLPLRSQLAVANGQRDILNQAIAQFEQQQKQLDESWSAMQKQAGAQNAVAQQIAAGAAPATTQPDASASASLAGLIQQLDQAQLKSDELRAQAEDRLNEAVKAFGDASTEAGNISGEINQLQREGVSRESARIVALTTLRDVFNPASLLFQQANAQYLLATVHAARASMLAERNRLNQLVGAAAQQASLSVPESVNSAELEAQISEANALSDSAYQATEELLLKIVEGQGSEEQKSAAKVARIFNLYAWSQANAASGNTEAAQQHLSDAIAARQQAEQDKIVLPSMPPALGASSSSGADSADAIAGAADAAADQFAEALSKGDADTAKSLVAADDQAATVDALIAGTAAFNTLAEAVAAKFSDAGTEALISAPNLASFIRDGEITVQGQAAQLSHANLAQPLALKQVDGAWKIDLSTLDPKQVAALQAIARVAPQLGQDIAAGKYATVEDLRQAVLSALAAPAQP